VRERTGKMIVGTVNPPVFTMHTCTHDDDGRDKWSSVTVECDGPLDIRRI
jgi:hypothetical protein